MSAGNLHFSLFAIILGVISSASADPPEASHSPFVVVFIDAKSEKVLGPFPYDRTVYANAIDTAAASGARGVVLKFFIDKPKTPDGDVALVQSAKSTKLLVQARLDDRETAPNPLPDRFRIGMNVATAGNLLAGKSGWIPLPALSAAAYDVGFVDFRVIDRMPMIERYGDSVVKSLCLSCLELAFGERAEVSPGKSVRLHGKTVVLDERSEIGVEYPAKDDLPYISFSDFIGGKTQPEAKDRVVILGYDSDQFEPVETPKGKIRPHRAFVYALMSLYKRFE
jgi:adenylate cyclase